MLTVSILVRSHDPLGRFDTASMPYVDLLELLVAGFENPNAVKRTVWGPRPPTWDGLQTDSNEEHLHGIFWPMKGLKGTLLLEYLPATTRKIDVSANDLSGSIDLTQFPRSIVEANLSTNSFEGTVVLTNLPDSLVFLNLMGNKLDGEINLGRLPASIRILYLSENSFNGSINLASLPAEMHHLNLEGNSLTGSVDFWPTWKEKREVCINLSDNKGLSGDVYSGQTQWIIAERTGIRTIEENS